MQNEHVHLEFRNIVAANLSATRITQVASYVSMLQKHDWHYDHSDDQNAWRKGSVERGELKRLQEVIDPKFEIWNQYCPANHMRGQS